MAYNASYDATDVAEASINGLTIFIIALAGLAGIFALILAFKWAKKNVK